MERSEMRGVALSFPDFAPLIRATRDWFTQPGLQSGLEAEEVKEARQVVDLASAGRRLTTHEVEDLSVFDAVIGKPLDPSILVEVNRDDALIDCLLHHEGDRPLGTLGDVVERLAAHGRNRRGRAQKDQNLLLARADRDLLERSFRNDVALLVG